MRKHRFAQPVSEQERQTAKSVYRTLTEAEALLAQLNRTISGKLIVQNNTEYQRLVQGLASWIKKQKEAWGLKAL